MKILKSVTLADVQRVAEVIEMDEGEEKEANAKKLYGNLQQNLELTENVPVTTRVMLAGKQPPLQVHVRVVLCDCTAVTQNYPVSELLFRKEFGGPHDLIVKVEDRPTTIKQTLDCSFLRTFAFKVPFTPQATESVQISFETSASNLKLIVRALHEPPASEPKKINSKSQYNALLSYGLSPKHSVAYVFN